MVIVMLSGILLTGDSIQLHTGNFQLNNSFSSPRTSAGVVVKHSGDSCFLSFVSELFLSIVVLVSYPLFTCGFLPQLWRSKSNVL